MSHVSRPQSAPLTETVPTKAFANVTKTTRGDGGPVRIAIDVHPALILTENSSANG